MNTGSRAKANQNLRVQFLHTWIDLGELNANELYDSNAMYFYSVNYNTPPTFISRDPMLEKYPSISPYTYCANNPVNVIDPTGKDGKVSYTESENGATIVIESTIHVYGKGAEEAAENANAEFAKLNNTSSVEIDGKTYNVELKITYKANTDLDYNADINNMDYDELMKIPGYVQGDNFLRVGVPEGGGDPGYAGNSQRGGHWGFSYGTSGSLVVHESFHNIGLGDTGFKGDIMNKASGQEINQSHYVGIVNMARNEVQPRQQKAWENQNLGTKWNNFGQNSNNPNQFNFTYRNRISY